MENNIKTIKAVLNDGTIIPFKVRYSNDNSEYISKNFGNDAEQELKNTLADLICNELKRIDLLNLKSLVVEPLSF